MLYHWKYVFCHLCSSKYFIALFLYKRYNSLDHNTLTIVSLPADATQFLSSGCQSIANVGPLCPMYWLIGELVCRLSHNCQQSIIRQVFNAINLRSRSLWLTQKSHPALRMLNSSFIQIFSILLACNLNRRHSPTFFSHNYPAINQVKLQ